MGVLFYLTLNKDLKSHTWVPIRGVMETCVDTE